MLSFQPRWGEDHEVASFPIGAHGALEVDAVDRASGGDRAVPVRPIADGKCSVPEFLHCIDRVGQVV